jgi:hypothetical protein
LGGMQTRRRYESTVQTEERRKKVLYNAWILRFLQDEMKQVRKPIIGHRFTWLHVTLAHRGRSIATGVSVMARGMGRPSRRPGTRVYCTSWCTGVPGQRPGTGELLFGASSARYGRTPEGIWKWAGPIRPQNLLFFCIFGICLNS